MANVQLKDGTGNPKYFKATGLGTDSDPYVTAQDVNIGNTELTVKNPTGVPIVVDGSAVVQPVRGQASGLGNLQPLPTATTNGTAIGTLPSNAIGVRLYLQQAGDAVTFAIESTAPTSAPANTFTVSYSTTGPNWDENLAGGQMMYITDTDGSPKFRFY